MEKSSSLVVDDHDVGGGIQQAMVLEPHPPWRKSRVRVYLLILRRVLMLDKGFNVLPLFYLR